MSKITYADKVFLNENSGIADINKVKDADMNEIKTVVNGNDDEVQGIIAGNVYSTTETPTNKIWIDGKPIYRKVITGTTTTVNSQFTVAHGVSDYDVMMIDNKSFVKSVGANTLLTPINCPAYTSSSYDNRPVKASIIDGNISVYIGSYNGYSSYTYNIIIEYTKTTD